MVWRRACLAAITATAVVSSLCAPTRVVWGEPQLHVNTDGTSNITSNSARVIGDLVSFGPSGRAEISFQWGLTSNNTTASETSPQQMVALGSFSADLSGLSANTTYFYRAKAVAQSATDYGPWKSFITSGGSVTYTLATSAGVGGVVTSPSVSPSQYSAGQVVNLVATANTGYHFVNWTGSVSTVANANAATTTITMNANYTVSANFAQDVVTYTLTTLAGVGGVVTSPSVSPSSYNAGQVVTLAATANTGYHFVNWTGSISTVADANAASTTITMNGNYTVTANFALDTATYTLTTSAGTGGSVTSPAVSPSSYNAGQVVNLAAATNTGYHFVNWTGSISTVADANAASTTITMNGNYTVTANFALDTATYTLTTSAGAGGLVTSPATSPSQYSAGQVVNLVAAANTGYHFVNWTGSISTVADVNAATTTITMNGNYSVTANFAADVVTYTLTVAAGPGGTVTSPGLGPFTYGSGQLANLVAAPGTYYHFVNWSGDTGSVANPNAATTTITVNGSYSIQANFAIDTYSLTVTSGPGGTATSPGVGTFGPYDAGTSVNLAASASNGYHFVSWTGDVSRIGNVNLANTTISMKGNYSVQATFAADAATYSLTVSASSGGTVTSPGVGQFGPYNSGSAVNLTAAASTGYHFVNWTGGVGTVAGVNAATTTITMNGNYSVIANFAADVVTYTLTASAGVGGTLASPATSPIQFSAGQVVNLAAAAATGYHFVNWTGAVSTVADANAATTTITMNGNYIVAANFAANPQPPTGGGGGSLGGGGGGGGGGGVPAGPGITSLAAYTNSDGVFNIPATPRSDDGKAQVDIAQGVQGKTKDGGPLKSVSVVKASDAAPPSTGSTIVVPAYDFGPDGATFSPPITLEFSYDRTVLPQGVSEKNLTVVAWDPASGIWTDIDSVVDATGGRITTSISHFSRYAVTVRTRPAAFAVGALSISPVEAKPGETVSVNVMVTNLGDVAGSLPVSLMLDGKSQATQDVSVKGNSEQQATFRVTSDVPGVHQVDVNGSGGFFTLSRPLGPAVFTTSLSISSNAVDLGNPPVVTVLVKNTGESTGTRTVILTINGKQASSDVVELAPGSARTLDITATADIPGSYTVVVDEHSASYVVNALALIPQRVVNWWLVGLAVAVVTAAASFTGFRLRRRAPYVPPIPPRVDR